MTAAIGAALSSASSLREHRPAPAADAWEAAAQPANAVPVLSVQSVTLSFGGVLALSEVDFNASSGEIRAIIGPNGAGKSSLINVISGIYRPDKGLVQIRAQNFRQVPTQRLGRLGVARTFQNLALFKGLSVLDNVVVGRVAASRASFVEQVVGTGRARRERDAGLERASRMLRFLHLDHLRDRPVGTLPYGLQKRVELARALMPEPRLLLLDEPMAGMTAPEKGEMAAFIRAARDEFDTTVVLIEHDVGIVMGLADRVTVLDYGRVIADGEPEEVRTDQAVIDAYLGVSHDESGDV